MRRTAFLFALLIGLGSSPAAAGPPFACCVCVEQGTERPLFCRAIASDQIPELEAGCTIQGGTALPCLAAISTDSCNAFFKRSGCTPAATAPAVGSHALFALTVLLGGVGALTLRARRARHR